MGTFESYEISDHDGETSESDSEEEERNERGRRAGKKVGRWLQYGSTATHQSRSADSERDLSVSRGKGRGGGISVLFLGAKKWKGSGGVCFGG